MQSNASSLPIILTYMLLLVNVMFSS